MGAFPKAILSARKRGMVVETKIVPRSLRRHLSIKRSEGFQETGRLVQWNQIAVMMVECTPHEWPS